MMHPVLAPLFGLFAHCRYSLQLVIDRQPHPPPYVIATEPVEDSTTTDALDNASEKRVQRYRCKQVTWSEYIRSHSEEIEAYVQAEGARKFHYRDGLVRDDIDYRQFRSYTGYGNNRDDPYCGMANMPYGQVLPFRDWAALLQKPDPLEVERRLNARPAHWPEFQRAPNHTNGFVSMFAFLIIHDFFHSDMVSALWLLVCA